MVNKRPIILLILVAAVVIFPLLIYSNQGEEQGYFTGSDDAAGTIVEETGYQPWFSSIWQPPSGEIENLIFAVQASIGALIIGYVLGYWKGKAKARKHEEVEENSKTGQ